MKPILLTTLALGALALAACGNNADKTEADAAAGTGMDASATAPAEGGAMAPSDGASGTTADAGSTSGAAGSMTGAAPTDSTSATTGTRDVPAETATGTPGSEQVMTGGRQNFTPPSSPNMGSQGPTPR